MNRSQEGWKDIKEKALECILAMKYKEHKDADHAYSRSFKVMESKILKELELYPVKKDDKSVKFEPPKRLTVEEQIQKLA
jgi:hypothetical protein